MKNFANILAAGCFNKQHEMTNQVERPIDPRGMIALAKEGITKM